MLEAEDVKGAIRKVATSPKLLAEAREKLNLVSRLASPITEAEFYVVLQPLIILHGPPDFGEDEAAEELKGSWFDIYFKALKDHPREALEIAVSECIRLRKFPDFPKPGYLNELAQDSTTEIRLIAFRLRRAVEKADQHRPVRERTPEEMEAVRAAADSLRGPDGRISLAVKSTEHAAPPSDRKATAEALRKLADFQ